jgi:hypothetical protein
MPDFDAMVPGLASAARQQNAAITAQLQKFGALQSVAFKTAGPNGADTFEVIFEHAKTDWTISFSPDGKITDLGFRPAN